MEIARSVENLCKTDFPVFICPLHAPADSFDSACKVINMLQNFLLFIWTHRIYTDQCAG